MELRSQVTAMQKRMRASEKVAREQAAEKESLVDTLTEQLREKTKDVANLRQDMSTARAKHLSER